MRARARWARDKASARRADRRACAARPESALATAPDYRTDDPLVADDDPGMASRTREDTDAVEGR